MCTQLHIRSALLLTSALAALIYTFAFVAVFQRHAAMVKMRRESIALAYNMCNDPVHANAFNMLAKNMYLPDSVDSAHMNLQRASYMDQLSVLRDPETNRLCGRHTLFCECIHYMHGTNHWMTSVKSTFLELGGWFLITLLFTPTYFTMDILSKPATIYCVVIGLGIGSAWSSYYIVRMLWRHARLFVREQRQQRQQQHIDVSGAAAAATAAAKSAAPVMASHVPALFTANGLE